MEQPGGSILNILALIASIAAVLIVVVILMLIVLRGWRTLDNNLLLATNTYVTILLCSVILFSLNTSTRLGDLQIYIYPDSIACHVRGYLLLYAFQWLFLSFALQALGRMFNIIYRQQRVSLQSLFKTKMLILSVFLISIVLSGPHVPLKSVVYEPEEFQCITNFHRWENYTYIFPTIYLGPIAIVVASYGRVIMIVRHSPLRAQARRLKMMSRDVLVLQRIVFIVTALIIVGLPTISIWLYWLFTRELNRLAYRIQAMTLSMSMLFLAVTFPLINPQVKSLLVSNRNRRVAPVVPMINPTALVAQATY